MRSTIARTTRSMGLDFIRKNAIAASRRRECLRWQSEICRRALIRCILI